MSLDLDDNLQNKNKQVKLLLVICGMSLVECHLWNVYCCILISLFLYIKSRDVLCDILFSYIT